MSQKPIFGQISVEMKGLGGVRQRLESGNFANTWLMQRILYAQWDDRWYQNGAMYFLQWKVPSQFPTPGVTQNLWATLGNEDAAGGQYYNWCFNDQRTFDQWEPARLRRYHVGHSQVAANYPNVISAVVASVWEDTGYGNVCRNNWYYNPPSDPTAGGRIGSGCNIPTTMIGTAWCHPIYSWPTDNITITSGSSWVKVPITSSNAKAFYWNRPGTIDTFYIISGSFKGQYWPRQCYMGYDSFMYLQLVNLDGTLFNPTATETVAGFVHGPNRSYFNQVGVLANSTGTVSFDGTFDPGVNRQSYILKVYPFKSGSSNPTDAWKKGSYYFSLRAYHSRSGDLGSAGNEDTGFANSHKQHFDYRFHTIRSNVVQVDVNGNLTTPRAYCNGVVFDETTQRMWFINDRQNSGGSYLGFWVYKSPETPIEVACTATAGGYYKSILSAPVDASTGNVFTSIDIGSDGTIYVANKKSSGSAGTGSVIAIKRDLTAAHWHTGDGMPSDNVAYVAVDKSRYRSGTNLDTSVGTGNCYDNAGTMTAYDLGRVIKITTGADAGTYKISAVTDANNFTVTTLADGAVSFTGDTGKAWNIGDRIYLFFGDYTTNNGHIHYMESLALGSFFQLTISGVTTAGRDVDTGRQFVTGGTQRVAIDQRTGCVYWLSNEVSGAYAHNATNSAIYKLNPSTGVVQSLNGTALATPPGSPVNTPAAFTEVHSIAVNPHPDFPELWVGANKRHIKIPLSDFSASSFSLYWYYDNRPSTGYQNPAGFFRHVGCADGARGEEYSANPAEYLFQPDGKVNARLMGWHYGLTSSSCIWTIYSRQSDNWHQNQGDRDGWEQQDPSWVTSRTCMDPYGTAFMPGMFGIKVLFGFENTYQWTGSAWVPKEVVKGSLPDATSSPDCDAKEMHTTFQDLIMGVRVKFTPPGSTPEDNNVFLGVAGKAKTGGTDGDTSTGTNLFGGSLLSSADVNRYLRIESGTMQGVYCITSWDSGSGKAVLGHPDRTAWTASATEGSLSYSVWDVGTPGSPGTSGPEPWTVMLADGIGRDNTQDMGPITYETFHCKTVLSDDAEATKFCIPNIFGPKNAKSMKMYWGTYPRTTPQWKAAASSILGIDDPSMAQLDTVVPNPLDGLVHRSLEGETGSTYFRGEWYGIYANTSVTGLAGVVDLGKDVDVGYVLIRGGQFYGNGDGNINSLLLHGTQNGQRTTLYNFPDGSTPNTNLTDVRCSGVSNLNLPSGNTTINLSSGDFLGNQDGDIGTPNDGVVVQNGNTLASAVGRFEQTHTGQVLKVTASGDVGSYRITAVSGDGSTVTVRNLDQTAKVWSVSASGVSFQVWDAVQDEDVIYFPNTSSSNFVCIERLLTTTTAQIRTCRNDTAYSNQSWTCVKSLWKKVKRLWYSPKGVPPEVVDNKTWINGCDTDRGVIDIRAWIAYFDLTDLSASQRTGRWWKLAMMPRFDGNYSGNTIYGPSIDAIEFYDTSGNRIGHCNYNRLDSVANPANVRMTALSQVIFPMGSNSAWGESGTNGLCDLTDDQVTLSGSNKFVPYYIRRSTTGSFDTGTSVFNDSGGVFLPSDKGRWLHIDSGSLAGTYLRITGFNSVNQVSVANIDGTAFSFSTTESGLTFMVHEGFAAGVSAYDYIWIEGYGELPILSISNDRSTITVGIRTTKTLTGKQWEVRRKALPVLSAPSIDPTQTARLFSYTYDTYKPQQSGDVQADVRGFLKFHIYDCGSGASRTGGSAGSGNNEFTCYNYPFFPDDVGRILHIELGNNIGTYKIASYVNANKITVTHLDGTAVTFTSEGSIGFVVFGERRYRATRYVTGLKS